MTITKIGTDFVVVRSPDESTDAIDSKRLRDLFPGASISALGPVVAIRSMRDQIEVAIDPQRIVFNDEYADRFIGEGFAQRASDLIALLMEIGVRPQERGWNFKVEYRQPDEDGPAAARILNRFVNSQVLGQLSGQLTAAELKIHFGENPKWFLDLEPRWGDLSSNLLFVHGNVHIETPYDSAPAATDVYDEGERLHGEFQDMIRDVLA